MPGEQEYTGGFRPEIEVEGGVPLDTEEKAPIEDIELDDSIYEEDEVGDEEDEDVNDLTEESDDVEEETPDPSQDDDDLLDIFDDTYKLGKYSMESFKDRVDFLNPVIRAELDATVLLMEEKGFTQEQAELFLETKLQTLNLDEEDDTPAPDPVEYLKKTLSPVEKQDYKVVGNFLKSRLTGTEMEGLYKEAMQNPHVYKLVRTLMKNGQGRNEEPLVDKARVERRIPASKIKDAYIDLISEKGLSKDEALKILEKKAGDKVVRKALSEFY